MKQIIYKFIFCKIFGWKVVGTIAPEVKKCVLIAVPHTSWWDFFLGIFSRGILNIEINYVAKKELFRFPFGAWFRWMGGVALDRTGNRNRVEAIVDIFNKRVLRLNFDKTFLYEIVIPILFLLFMLTKISPSNY